MCLLFKWWIFISDFERKFYLTPSIVQSSNYVRFSWKINFHLMKYLLKLKKYQNNQRNTLYLINLCIFIFKFHQFSKLKWIFIGKFEFSIAIFYSAYFLFFYIFLITNTIILFIFNFFNTKIAFDQSNIILSNKFYKLFYYFTNS